MLDRPSRHSESRCGSNPVGSLGGLANNFKSYVLKISVQNWPERFRPSFGLEEFDLASRHVARNEKELEARG
jgi:hypothetical protein